MRILLIKTSSMGDLIHTFPALTDAKQVFPDIIFDWVVEENFAEIPHWHPQVGKVIPVALRRWRKNLFSISTYKEIASFREKLRAEKYDYILDAQGLVKSAWLTFLVKGKRAGLGWRSARESLASVFYQQKAKVNFYQHAILRMRSLFSQILKYPLPQTAPQFSLQRNLFANSSEEKYLVFLHGTTWVSKQWPESYWVQLARIANQHGYRIKISGGNNEEIERAERIAKEAMVEVLPRLSIEKMARLLVNAKGAVAVDTGFGHLAAALDIPTISLYGPTNADYTGVIGNYSAHLSAQFACAPCLRRTCTYREPTNVEPACFAAITPTQVWKTLEPYL